MNSTKWLLEFTPSLEDGQIFNLYHHRNSPTLRKQYFIGQIITTVIVFAGIFLLFYLITNISPGPTPPEVIYSFSCLAFILAAFIFFYYPHGYKNKIFKDTEKLYNETDGGYVSEKCTMLVNSDGLQVTSKTGEGKLEWGSMDKIVVNNDYIYIYVNAVDAIIIPERAFSSDDERHDFIDYIQPVRTEASGLSIG